MMLLDDAVKGKGIRAFWLLVPERNVWSMK